MNEWYSYKKTVNNKHINIRFKYYIKTAILPLIAIYTIDIIKTLQKLGVPKNLETFIYEDNIL